MHDPVDVPANGRSSDVPTRPSGSKSTRIEPVPVGPPGRLQEPSWATARSTAFVACARGNAPVGDDADADAAVLGGLGVTLTGGRGAITVGFTTTVGFALAEGAAEGSSRRGTVSTLAPKPGLGGSGFGFLAMATTNSATAPNPSSPTTAMLPTTHFRAELSAGTFPAATKGSGTPHDRQYGALFARRSSTRAPHREHMRAAIAPIVVQTTEVRLRECLQRQPHARRAAATRTLGNVLVFNATTATAGSEPWKTDGTTAGTGLLADTMPGTFGGGPGEFLPHAGAIFFSSNRAL